MVKIIKSLLVVLAFASAGFAGTALGIVEGPASAQQALPTGSAPGTSDVREGAAPPAGASLKSAARESAAALAPDVKLALEQVGKRVEALETLLTRLVEQVRARAIGYALWAAGGLFALMFLSSVLGGTVVALVLRRSRSV